MDSILVPGSSASLAFESLSWRSTVGLDPARPFRKVGVELVAGPPAQLRALESGAEVGYRLAITRRGDYRIRLRLGGELRALVNLELTREGETAPDRSATLAAAAFTETGPMSLRPGVFTLSIALPARTALEAIEVVPPCLNPIEPPGGWQPTAVTLTGDVAVTLLKATDLEDELPNAAPPIEVPAAAFQLTTARTLPIAGPGQSGDFTLRAEAGGLETILHLDLPEPGLYSLSMLGVAGGGQSWLVDSCLRAVLCPRSESEAATWIPLLTSSFAAGRHSFAVTLASGAQLQRLKIERKKDGVPDYLATVARLGLDLGEQRPIARPRAVEALDFIRTRRRATLSRCDEILLPSALVAGLAMPGAVAATGGNVAVPGAGGVPVVPLPGPSTPATTTPASPASPTPTVSPTPAPSPTPSPSIGPPPTTLLQPPASPVKD